MKHNYIYIFIILLMCSCGRNHNKSSVVSPQTSVQIKRYEVALFKLDPGNLHKELKPIQKEYRLFLGDNINEPNNIKQLRDYLTDPAIKQVYDDCMKEYPDLRYVENKLGLAFSRYKSLYPDAKLPKVYTYISGIDYNSSVNYADSVLIIPLDMYLGSDYATYSKIGIPEYITMRLTKDYIVRDCIRKIGESKIPEGFTPRTLLDFMIIKGKILYFTKSVIPDITDNMNMAYNNAQFDWCRSNESNLWSFLINNKMLFSDDDNTITKFINDSPFTSIISKDAPGRLGEWIGWQIVKSYMENNRNISLQELMKDTDSQSILTNSRYKPGR